MNKLAENLKTLMAREGLSEAALAERAGINQPTINRIVRGESRDPRDRTIAPLAEYFGVGLWELKHGSIDVARPAVARVPVHAYAVEAVEDDENFNMDEEVWVDSVEVEAAAGPGGVVPEFVPTRYRQRYTLKWFRELGVKPEHVKIMGVRGESMEPTLYGTDRVAVNVAEKDISSGRVYAFLLSDECRIKRLFRTADGGIRIVSDNPDKQRYPDEYINARAATFALIGRVIERKGTGGL